MSIQPSDVAHIADLARITLTKEELQKFEKDLSAILDFIGQLQEVDTAHVEAMTGGTLADSIMRDDTIRDTSIEHVQARLLASAPDLKEHWVRVKKILHHS